MKLKTYLEEASLTQKGFAKIIRRSRLTVLRWVNGETTPEKEDMAEIYRITGGKVTPSDFYDLPCVNGNLTHCDKKATEN